MANVWDAITTAAGKVDLSSALDKTISYLRIKSAYGPDLVLQKPFQTVPPDKRLTTQTEKFFRLMKPQFEIGIEGAATPIVLHPYGTPPVTQWGTVMVVSGVVAGTLAFFGIMGLVRTIRGG